LPDTNEASGDMDRIISIDEPAVKYSRRKSDNEADSRINLNSVAEDNDETHEVMLTVKVSNIGRNVSKSRIQPRPSLNRRNSEAIEYNELVESQRKGKLSNIEIPSINMRPSDAKEDNESGESQRNKESTTSLVAKEDNESGESQRKGKGSRIGINSPKTSVNRRHSVAKEDNESGESQRNKESTTSLVAKEDNESGESQRKGKGSRIGINSPKTSVNRRYSEAKEDNEFVESQRSDSKGYDIGLHPQGVSVNRRSSVSLEEIGESIGRNLQINNAEFVSTPSIKIKLMPISNTNPILTNRRDIQSSDEESSFDLLKAHSEENYSATSMSSTFDSNLMVI
jgi:hypothetical protein